MGLKEELGFKQGFKILEHEAVLNVYYTASVMKKRADTFFRKFELTNVQFNALMLLKFQSGKQGGLSQAQLSEMMLVNRANITTLIDRMEYADLVERTEMDGDRRCNIIVATSKGKRKLAKVEPLYRKMIKETIGKLSKTEQKGLVKVLGKVRERISS